MSRISSLLFCALLVASVFSLSLAQTSAPATTQADKVQAEKWREDLRYMAEEMPKYHKTLFHTITREQFESAIKKLDERIPSLARHQIIVEMARIVAMVGDGHTNIAPTRDPKIGFRTYPIKLYFFKDGLYVRAATREHADLVGARVDKIGKLSVEQAYKAVREIIGRDNEMDVKYFAANLLVMSEVLHALGLIDDMENARFIVERRGEQSIVDLKPFGPADLIPPDTDTTWMPTAGWIDARGSSQAPVLGYPNAQSTPLWLKDPLNKFWFEYLADSKTIYVQFNQVGNKEDETVEAFAKRLFAFVGANPVDRFVLDLRLNRGGNGEFNRPLLLGIIRSKIDQKGKLFTIVGRSTWSAAQFLTNELEKYTNTIFVGEPTGGKVNSYGDSRKITLPNSGITVRVSTLWWQEDERDTRQWTAPQIAADLTFEDYRDNNDPALRAILNYVPKKPLADLLKEAALSNDFKLAAERYREWKADPVNEYVNAEPLMTRLGYELMAMKRFDQAIGIFKLNVDAFPQSANVYDSLGEAYMTSGNRELAILNYEKALGLNPNMRSATEALRKLRGK
jgi:tetratricopeptide (TPR) repeat protein